MISQSYNILTLYKENRIILPDIFQLGFLFYKKEAIV